jgi:chemotaxis protein methyltransferase CheR
VSWSQPAFESIAAVLSRRTGLSISPSRQASAEQSIRRAMRRAGDGDLDSYCRQLEVEETALDQLVVELSVGETYFFREPEQFAYLRREVVPFLRARAMARAPGTNIRAWSAGCASGEEAYSLAMLLESEGLAQHASVFGTDISRAALQRAKSALYTGWSLRGVGAALARPYLVRRDTKWEVVDSIRRLVTFAHLNLALDVYPSLAAGVWGMDVIFCRNVLIYFDALTSAAVARRLFASLAPGGWLFLASSDPPLNEFAPFEIVVASEGVFYRRASADDPIVSEQHELGLRSQPIAHIVYPSHSIEPLPLPFDEGEKECPSPECRTSFDEPAPPPRIGEVARGSGEASEQHDALTSADLFSRAQAAFALGEYHRVLEITSEMTSDPAVCALRVRALANVDGIQAECACAEAASRHALCAELHYLHGTLLLALGRDAEAARSVRRALYLDRSLAAAHFVLGSIMERCGDDEQARRAFRNAVDLCASGPADEELPLAEGERAGRLAQAARARLALLDKHLAKSTRRSTTSEVPK